MDAHNFYNFISKKKFQIFFKVLVNMLKIGTDCSGIEAPIESYTYFESL